MDSKYLLHFKETQALYDAPNYLEDADIDTLLTLDRNLLIEDLVYILKDCKDRREYLSHDNNLNNHNIIFHVLGFLYELNAHEATQDVLDIVFSDNGEYVDDWLGYEAKDILTIVLGRLAQNQLELLEERLYVLDNDIYIKSYINSALNYIHKSNPESRAKIDEIWVRLLDYFIHCPDEVTFSDDFGTYIAFILCDMNVKLAEPFSSKIKQLFDIGRVESYIVGDYESYMASEYSYEPDAIYHIYELNNNLREYAQESDEEKRQKLELEIEKFYNHTFKTQMPIQSEKIGRNEPCPCGSGKKYKKCCL